MTTKTIPINHIIIDMDINPREDINRETVERYAGIIETMPIIDIFDIAGEGYVLAAGFHRLEANKLLKVDKVKVKVHNGSREDAKDFAYKSNAKNPLQLTTDELLEVAKWAIQRDPYAMDETLAKDYGVSKPMLRQARKLLNWNTGSFPDMRDVEEVDIPLYDPRIKERDLLELYWRDRRKTTLVERMIPCQVCTWPLSVEAHLLDFATWGDTPHTMRLCVRCHELFDLMVKELEEEGDRAWKLIAVVKEKVGEDSILNTLSKKANDIVLVRRVILEHYEASKLHRETYFPEAAVFATKEQHNGQ